MGTTSGTMTWSSKVAQSTAYNGNGGNGNGSGNAGGGASGRANSAPTVSVNGSGCISITPSTANAKCATGASVPNGTVGSRSISKITATTSTPSSSPTPRSMVHSQSHSLSLSQSQSHCQSQLQLLQHQSQPQQLQKSLQAPRPAPINPSLAQSQQHRPQMQVHSQSLSQSQSQSQSQTSNAQAQSSQPPRTVQERRSANKSASVPSTPYQKSRNLSPSTAPSASASASTPTSRSPSPPSRTHSRLSQAPTSSHSHSRRRSISPTARSETNNMSSSTTARHHHTGKYHCYYNNHHHYNSNTNSNTTHHHHHHPNHHHGSHARNNHSHFFNNHHHHSNTSYNSSTQYPHAPPSYYTGGCKYETALAHFRRRMPYYIGMDPLPSVDLETIKSELTAEEDKKITHDMRELYRKLLPNPESDDRKEKFMVKLEKMLNDRWPGNSIKLRIFGSSGNKLCSSDSDDLEHVCMLADFLATNGMERVVCVSHAKVPIVKMWDPELKVACDMNVNNTMALENTRMVRTYVEIDERVRILAMVVKHWTKRRSLNDAALGGTLSSYTWICMCINFLQTRDPPILPSLQKRPHEDQRTTDGKPAEFDSDMEALKGFSAPNTSSLAQLLFEFFRYYGYEYDYETSVVSVREGRVLRKSDKGWHLLQNNRLCVEEPFNTTRNLGNTADDCSFKGLHMEIRRAFDLLCNADLESACELYIPPPEEETKRLEAQSVFERPPQQHRMPIQPIPPHRGGRGSRRGNVGGRGGARRPSPQTTRGGGQAGLSGLLSGARQSQSALTAEMQAAAAQAQQVQAQAQAQAQYLQDQLFQQMQAIQAQEEIRLGQQGQGQSRSPNSAGQTEPPSHPTAALTSPTNWLAYPFIGQQIPPSAVQEGGASQQSFPGTPHRTRQQQQQQQQLQQQMAAMFYSAPYAYLATQAGAISTPQQLQTSSTSPPSPVIRGASSFQGQDRGEDLRSGRSTVVGRSSSLRASSQPARPTSGDETPGHRGLADSHRSGFTPVSNFPTSHGSAGHGTRSSSPIKKTSTPIMSPPHSASGMGDVSASSQGFTGNEDEASTPTMAYSAPQPGMYPGDVQQAMALNPMDYLQHYVNMSNPHAQAAAFAAYQQYQQQPLAQMHGYSNMPGGSSLPMHASGASAGGYPYMAPPVVTSPQRAQGMPAELFGTSDSSPEAVAPAAATSTTPRSAPGTTGGSSNPRSPSQLGIRGPLIVDGSSPVVERRLYAARDDPSHGGYARSLPGAFTPLVPLPAEEVPFDPASLHQHPPQPQPQQGGHPLSQSLPDQTSASGVGAAAGAAAAVAPAPLYGYHGEIPAAAIAAATAAVAAAAHLPQVLPFNPVPWGMVNPMAVDEHIPGPESLAERLRRFQVQGEYPQSTSESSHGGSGGVEGGNSGGDNDENELELEQGYETQDELPVTASSPEVSPEEEEDDSSMTPVVAAPALYSFKASEKSPKPFSGTPHGQSDMQAAPAKTSDQRVQHGIVPSEGSESSSGHSATTVRTKDDEPSKDSDVPPWRRKTGDSSSGSGSRPSTRSNSKASHGHHLQKSKDSGHDKEKFESSYHSAGRRARDASNAGAASSSSSAAASVSHPHTHVATQGGWQTTTSRKKGRKGLAAKSSAASSSATLGGPEPLPADESLRKGG
ncbi:hypothetical protein KEM54_000087 [Ascosphaera aggregata]|nr:hypothetical protein KEM54_000087 [Ascosphaera aggregata]